MPDTLFLLLFTFFRTLDFLIFYSLNIFVLRYQSSKRRQVLGLTKVVKEKVKNVSIQTIDIIDNNLIEAFSDIKNKLNHEINNSNCYVQTNPDTTSDDEVDDGTYDDRFDEGDFDESLKYFKHYYL